VNLRRTSKKVLALLLVYLASMTFVANAADEDKAGGRVPFPVIPMGQGDSCVEDTDFMRRNHMSMLKHQRDETVLKGIRAEQHSLKECINCHVVNGPDAKPLTVASPQHFCRSCHDYAAVSIDCFQCHASRPESGAN
jgi:predicted CXXCH cytochrome family protein